MSNSTWNRNFLAFAIAMTASAGSIVCGQTQVLDYDRNPISAVSDETQFDTKLLSPRQSCIDAGVVPVQPGHSLPGSGETSQFAQPPETPFDLPSSPGSLQAGQGSLTAQNNVAAGGFTPNFIGDSFGSGGFQSQTVFGTVSTLIVPVGTIGVLSGGLGSAPGANIGRSNLVENSSPIPRDRVYTNYSYFNNTPLVPGGVNVNRVTPGFEKTFLGGNASVEVRMPFASTINNTISQDGKGNYFSSDGTQLGNLTTYFKGLLYRNETFAVSSGLGLALPTAQSFNLKDTTTGSTLVHVNNQAVHLLPFIGGVYTPNQRFFAQSMLQFDIDPMGNSVQMQDFGNSTGQLYSMGRAHDASWVFASVSTGYWVYRDFGSNNMITGIAPIIELHDNSTMSNAQGVSANVPTGLQYVGQGQATQLINGTVGVNILFRDQGSLVLGFATPIAGVNDRQFDGEFRVLFNWYFGRTTPQRRVQF